MATSDGSIQDGMRRFRFQQIDAMDDFDIYIRRFELELGKFGLRKQIGEHEAATEARRTLLLSCCSHEVFKIVTSHFAPVDIETKSYEEIKWALQRYFAKPSCYMGERISFSKRYRGENESISQFINSLRSMAQKCEFTTGTLDERLRDQLVIGINNDQWQQELIQRYPLPTTTLQDIEISALALEAASNQCKAIKVNGNGQVEASSTNRVRPNISLKSKGIFPRTKPNNIPSTAKRTTQVETCTKCGKERHTRGEDCPAKGKTCRQCGKSNHFAAVCRSRVQSRFGKYSTNQIGRVQQSDNESDIGDRSIRAIPGQGRKAIVHAELNGHEVKMLYDPGAAFSVISKSTWKAIGSPQLRSTPNLMAYTQVPVETLGKASITVKAFEQTKIMDVYVVKGEDQPLFSIDWCIKFGLQFPTGVQVYHVKKPINNLDNEANHCTEKQINYLVKKYSNIFNDDDIPIKVQKAVIHLHKDAKPMVFRPRNIAFKLRQLVEAEIQRLVHKKILEPVDPTITPIEWASPTVCVVKPNGQIRLCGDFKVTINPYIINDPHPLPRFEEMVDQLSGGRYFSVIDLKDAYLQMEVAEESRKYLVIATHKGYFRYTRLPFGVNFAPALFQRTMEKVLCGINGVKVYIDDIIVSGQTIDEHMQRLEKVFERLEQSNVKTQESKCRFLKRSVRYLGHQIDEFGIHPTKERIEALMKLPTPRTVAEVRSFLGSINYYEKFIPGLQSKCAPLHQLTKKGEKWNWTKSHEELIQQLKSKLTTNDTLVHYDMDKPIVLYTDACDQGLGAVLKHRYPDDTERPIAYASRSLTTAEKNYSTIDKEGLAIMFGVTKFHQYLYGCKFKLKTDHKPLERIFGAKRQIPKILNNRLTRWALTLSTYDYDIEYIDGSKNQPADMLSRLPIKGELPSDIETLGKRYQLLNIKLEEFPMTKRELQNRTLNDKVLSQVILSTNRGWPEDRRNVKNELHTFFDKRYQLSIEENILIWQGRMVIPETLRNNTLHALHEGHPGASGMKAMARFHVWWPNIDNEIEEFVKRCGNCQANRATQPEVPLFSWSIPSEPWSRLHIDYAGPFEGKHWLIVIDAHSKWMEVLPTRDTSTRKTIKLLRDIFARFGLPHLIVSDNGPQFKSEEFETWCKVNGIKHATSTPYHPKTNGLAERAVRTFKDRFNTMRYISDLDKRLAEFLLAYRTTPQSTTGSTPSELLLGRRSRIRLDLIRPNRTVNIDRRLVNQKINHDRHTSQRHFSEGEDVWIKRIKDKGFEPGTILRKTSTYSYIALVNGKTRRVHADQLRKRFLAKTDPIEVAESESDSEYKTRIGARKEQTNQTIIENDQVQTTSEHKTIVENDFDEQQYRTEADELRRRTSLTATEEQKQLTNESTTTPPCSQRNYPTRTRRPPERFQAEDWRKLKS